VALRSGQKTIENCRISPPFGLLFLYKRADILTQRSRRIQKRHPRRAPAKSWCRKSCLFEPMQYVLVALQDVPKLPIHSHASVEKIQRKMPTQEQWAGL